jgi:uncharacterized protein (TIGR00375 family)
MEYIADLHIHSRFSRATAKNLDLENLHTAAQLKGVRVVGTGDVTHPGWFEEIRQKLIPAEPGLFKLRDDVARVCDLEVPPSCRSPVRFMLVTEISNIYKKKDRTRKNHNLVFLPDMDAAARFNSRLEAIGNIKSDGRPILGLDARDLLEIVLETDDSAFLIPAHIWTPWFSMLGSKSGFDSVSECFDDLTRYIFAVETGLSSDPAMNWRVSELDDYTLVSNSDAHSPPNLGREANLFKTELSYFAIRDALRRRDPEAFGGTIEFYPDQGKYHLDGHRNCHVRLLPEQSVENGGNCPVCRKPLTIGVLYRVEELADRGWEQRPEVWFPFENLVPLTDILSEILQVGPKTKRAGKAYRCVIETLGPELSVLRKTSLDDIDSVGVPLLAEAVRRVRGGEVIASAGYDGEYGRITVFSETDRLRLLGQRMLFAPDAVCAEEAPCRPLSSNLQPEKPAEAGCATTGRETVAGDPAGQTGFQFNPDQQRAVTAPNGAMLIVAGPGSGKTRTLTARIGHLIDEKDIGCDQILAVTFTNKAAAEMRHRLRRLISKDHPLPPVATFHGLCLRLLKEHRPGEARTIVDDRERPYWMSEAIRAIVRTGQAVPLKPGQLIERIGYFKQQMMGPDDIIRADTYRTDNGVISLIYREYQKLLASQHLLDYEDLIFKVVRLLESDPGFRSTCQEKFCHIFVDEYQDVNFGQYRLVRALRPTVGKDQNLCVIGDPDQAIYGFRGSDVHFFNQFGRDYPGALRIRLKRNYRSTRTILKASYHVIRASRSRLEDSRVYSDINGINTITLTECASDRVEAEKIARTIESLIGGTGFHSVDTGMIEDANLAACRSYSDFAVLFRSHEQGRMIAGVFDNAGIPCQLTGRDHLLDQSEIGPLLALLRLVEARGSLAEFDRTAAKLMPGLGKKAIRGFAKWCRQNRMTVNRGLRQVDRIPIPGLEKALQLRLTEFSREIENIRANVENETLFRKLTMLSERIGVSDFFSPESKKPHARDYVGALADRYAHDIDGFLAAVALNTDTDIYSAKAQKVPLMTLHAAKGLEFPIVFIAGCEDTYLPFRRTGLEASDPEEERRLFYVGMTRARRRLFLSWAKRRRIYGKYEDRRPSPFLADIESRLLACNRSGKVAGKKKEPAQKQMGLF